MNRLPNLLTLWAVLSGICWSSPGSAAVQLPQSIRSAIEKADQSYKSSIEAADQKLLEAFSRQIALVPTMASGMKASEKQQLIDSLKVEREDFKKHRTLPFSPAMHKGALEYLSQINSARMRSEAAYESGISYLQKADKENNAASALRDEMKNLLKPLKLGTLTYKYGRFTQILPMTSDGKAGERATWVLDTAGITIWINASNAPKRVWIIRGTFDSTGKTCNLKYIQGKGHPRQAKLSNSK